MRSLYFLILILGIVLSGCSSQKVDYSKLYGFWEKELNNGSNTQKFVLYFAKAGEGNIECQFHSYFNGIKFSSAIGADIEFDGESISFIANRGANVRYEGKLDTVKRIIIGKLKYANGSDMEFNLERITEEKLAERYPGLFNLVEDDVSTKQPKNSDDGWAVDSLAGSGIDSDLMQNMIESINKGEFGKVHSVLIAKDGKLVFEKYFDGFYINDLNSLQSCTKSIGSILIGLAIDNGFVKGVNQKVLDFFPGYRYEVDKKWNDIELKHLLTMSVGLNWDRNTHDRVYEMSNDVIETTLEQKFSHEPGQIFEYRNPQTDLLSGIIMNSSKKPVQGFAKEYLFEPLGINEFSWDNFKKNSYPLMSGSLALSSRAMLKIGQLVLDKGKWNGKQVVPEKWINESTSFKIQTDQSFGYGYLWWLGESKVKPGLKAVFAIGVAGQHIVIIPEKNIVVVTTADNMDKAPEFLLKMIDEYIVKGIK